MVPISYQYCQKKQEAHHSQRPKKWTDSQTSQKLRDEKANSYDGFEIEQRRSPHWNQEIRKTQYTVYQYSQRTTDQRIPGNAWIPPIS